MVYGILYFGECLGLVHGQDSGWKIVPREVTSQILIQRDVLSAYGTIPSEVSGAGTWPEWWTCGTA
jgi:hypothetical protein